MLGLLDAGGSRHGGRVRHLPPQAGVNTARSDGNDVAATAGYYAQLGKGRYLIAEADESDQSFLLLQPSMSIITNIEPDHLVNYENSFENLKIAFLDFVKKLPFNGMDRFC